MHAFTRHRLARWVDRAEAGALVMALLVLAVAAAAAADRYDAVYVDRARAIAVEAATRHQVEATALEPSQPRPKGPTPAAPVGYAVHVQWFIQNATRDGFVEADHMIKAGEKLPLWVDEQGRLTRAPLTNATAHADAVGVAIMQWLASAAIVVGAMATLRWVLNCHRYRKWDRSLRLLIEEAGGSSTRRT